MPRFYFHTKDGQRVCDQEGTVLPDLDAACREAIKILSQMLPTLEEGVLFEDGYTVMVTDEEGLDLFGFDVTATSAPAVRRYGPA